MKRINPEIISVHDQEENRKEIQLLARGDHVKVRMNAKDGNTEAFWIKLTAVKGNTLHGKVDNDLVFVDLACDTAVEFSKYHVRGILKA